MSVHFRSHVGLVNSVCYIHTCAVKIGSNVGSLRLSKLGAREALVRVGSRDLIMEITASCVAVSSE